MRSGNQTSPWPSTLLPVATVGALWGVAFPLTRYLTSYVDPVWLVFGRVIGGTAVLYAGVRVARGAGLAELGMAAWPRVCLAGLLNIAIPWSLMAVVLRDLESSTVSVLNGFGPLLTFSLAVAIGLERWDVRRLLGLLLGLSGVVVVSGGALAGTGTSVLELMLLATAVTSYSLGGVFLVATLRGLPATTLALGQFVVASVALGVVCAATGFDVWVAPMSGTGWTGWTLLATANTGLAYLLLFSVALRNGPSSAASANYLTVVVGSTIGLVFLAEPVTWPLLAGGVLVLAGLVLATRSSALTTRSPLPPSATGSPA